MTPAFIAVVRKAWIAAQRRRTGNVCVLPVPGRSWFPPYVLGPDGFAVEFCDVPPTSRFAERSGRL